MCAALEKLSWKRCVKVGRIVYNDNVFSVSGLPNGEAHYDKPDEDYIIPGG